MSEEPLISQEDIETLKARDRRWKDVEISIRIDEELNNSVIVALILEALGRRSNDAINRLIQADPTDVRRIAALQEQVNCANYITASIADCRQKGVVAHQSLEEEGIELEPHNVSGSER